VNHFIVSQVNPHVAPFLYRYESQKSGLFSTIFYLLKSELKHRVTQLSELGLIPTFLSNIQPILTQTYRGDITIVPQISVFQYRRLISNPNSQMIQECITKGRWSTWSKISVIKYHCMIEFTLESCFAKLTHKLYENEIKKQHRSKDDQESNQSYSNSVSSPPRSGSMEFIRLNEIKELNRSS